MAAITRLLLMAASRGRPVQTLVNHINLSAALSSIPHATATIPDPVCINAGYSSFTLAAAAMSSHAPPTHRSMPMLKLQGSRGMADHAGGDAKKAASDLDREAAAASLQTSADPFHQGLQSKTEQELMQLIAQNSRGRPFVGPDGALDINLVKAASNSTSSETEEEVEYEDDEDDMVDVINPETREVYGPRGREPTRFGDWEQKGRCTDFQ